MKRRAWGGTLLAVLSLGVAAHAAGADAAPRADVTGVTTSGEPGRYRFHVGVASPDADCDAFARWWEVLRTDGSLVYRRILLHSHAEEQPFHRAGGPVPIAANETVIVRAFFHPTGYGGRALRGSVEAGFEPWDDAPAAFAAALAKAPPQPTGCRF